MAGQYHVAACIEEAHRRAPVGLDRALFGVGPRHLGSGDPAAPEAPDMMAAKRALSDAVTVADNSFSPAEVSALEGLAEALYLEREYAEAAAHYAAAARILESVLKV